MKTKYKIQITLLIIFVFFPITKSFSQLNGTYTIGIGGNYTTITSAVTDLVTNGVNGPVVFNIKPGTYTELVTIDSIKGSSIANNITFQSESGIQSDVLWENDYWIPPSLITLNKADYLTFKNISFVTGHFDPKQYIFYLISNCDNINIINNKMISNSVFNGAGIYCDNASTKNLTIKDNYIDGFTGIELISDLKSVNTQIINNEIRRIKGITIYNHDSLQIEKNKILTDREYFTSTGAQGIILQNCNNYLKISKNKIISSGPSFIPSIGISLVSCFCQNSQISNNMIYYVAGQGLVVSNSTNIKIYFNTIQSVIFFSGNTTSPNLFLTNCTNCDVKNNILEGRHTTIELQSDSFLTSDYNTFFYFNPNGTAEMFYYNGTSYNDLTQFRAASNSDFNSVVKEVFFVSNTDLHLTGTSIGDESLAGIPISGITDDIDGDSRSPFFPYMGADEADVTLPVELNSFTSAVSGRDVTLSWRTASETNNAGFDIERLASQSGTNVNGQNTDEWNKIGNVKGNGTTTSENNYSFTDKNLNSGKYKFRLKQIDYNGNFEYFNLSSEVEISIPVKYSLSQNYPNPFNPVTKINYELPFSNFVSLKIYDLTGKEIVSLVNENQNAGSYLVDFDEGKLSLSSGTYFYRLVVSSSNSLVTAYYAETKRMILLK